MQEIVIVGGGGHARVVASVIKKLSSFKAIGYSDREDHGALLGIPFLGQDSSLLPLVAAHPDLGAVLAVGQVGTGEKRQALWNSLKALRLSFPVVVSPDAVVNEDVVLGEASAVMDGAVVNCGARVGRGAILNTNSTIEHDVALGDWVHISPGATLSGGVVVGSGSMIGAGATVIEGVHIPAATFIGAGSTVINSLTEPGVYVGSPARRIR